MNNIYNMYNVKIFCFQKLLQDTQSTMQYLTSKTFLLFGSLYLDILKSSKTSTDIVAVKQDYRNT